MPSVKEKQWLQIINKANLVSRVLPPTWLKPTIVYARKSALIFSRHAFPNRKPVCASNNYTPAKRNTFQPVTLEVGNVKLHLTHDIKVDRLAAIVKAVQA